MSDNFTTIAIIGATSGIGEGLARRYHAQGKTIVATGRRLERLQALQKELPGLEIQQMDTADIATLPSQISTLLSTFPHIDTVMAVAGMQKSFSFLDPKASSAESIAQEVATNVTAPMVIARSIIPFLAAQAPKPTAFVTVSSGLAFVPLPNYPVYCPTKAAIHSFSVVLRAQCKDTNVNVVELAPPYVDTGLDAEHRERNIEAQGGEEKAVKPMGLEEYLDDTVEKLRDAGNKEVAVGFSKMGQGKWREAFGPALEMLGVKG